MKLICNYNLRTWEITIHNNELHGNTCLSPAGVRKKPQVGRQPGGIQWNDLWLNMVGAKMRESHHKMRSESVIFWGFQICGVIWPKCLLEWCYFTKKWESSLQLLNGFCFGPGSFGVSSPLDWVEKDLPKLSMWQDMQWTMLQGSRF